MANVIAKFETSTLNGVAPLTVTFTNSTSGPYVTATWDFGDGTMSTEINPVHQYLNAGSFISTLTVTTNSGVTSSASKTITAFSQRANETADTTVQYALSTTKRFEPGQVNVSKMTQSGSTFTSVFPVSGNGLNVNVYEARIVSSGMTGTADTDFVYNSGTYATLHTAFQNLLGQYTDCYVGCMITAQDTASPPTFTQAYNYSALTSGCNMIMYKIVSANTATTTVTVDRPLPNRGAGDTGNTNMVFFLSATGGGAYDRYSDQLTGTGVVVRQVQAVDGHNDQVMTGAALQHDNRGKGIMQLLGYDVGTGSTITVLYPHASGLTTAEAIYPGTTRVSIPHVLRYSAVVPGVRLYDTYDNTMREPSSGERFRYLRDGQSSADKIMGKVFYDKKMIVIDDQELCAVLQYNSNRNYTLCPPLVTLGSTTGGDTDSATTYFVTYRPLDTVDAASVGTGFGLGHLKPLPCMYIQKISPAINGAQLNFRLPIINSWNVSTPALYGFMAATYEVLVATGQTTGTSAEAYIPDANSWRYSAFTGPLSVAINGINIPTYSSLTAASFSGTPLSGNSNLAFGSGILGLAQITGSWESNIYRLSATCVAKNTEFNQTQNPTYSSSTVSSMYVTEVALYNENNELLMTGKLNKPLEKNEQKYVTVKLDLDL